MDIMWRDMLVFSDIVQLHSYEHGLGSSNTFTMATLPYAPKLCWLSGRTPPPPGFSCHYDTMRHFNDRLLQRNYLADLPPLDVSLMGTRRVDSNGLGVPPNLLSDYGQWRESAPWRMLHLNDKNRILMATRVTAYFAALLK